MPVAKEAGMKGWRERAADIFTNRGEIAAKMKSALGPGTSDSHLGFSPVHILQYVDWGDGN